jgi:tetratricopeptide (TPR) repeat protein
MFRQDLYQEKTDSLNKIEQFNKYIEENSFDEESVLTAKNIIAIETANFMENTSENEKKIYLLLINQENECSYYMKNNRNFGKWFLASYADIQTRLLTFVTSRELFKYSMSAKGMYQKSLKIDRNFGYALNGYGVWLYFAPPIAGGGYDAALKQLNRSIQHYSNDVDLFFAYIYRSQVYFAMGKNRESIKDLNSARSVFDSDMFISHIKEKNEKGLSFFD